MKIVVLTLLLLTIGDAAWAQQRSISAGPSQKADGFRGQNGRRVTFVCPATTVQPSARVWGSDPYTDDSNVCESAIHAGALQARQAGVVTVLIGGPQQTLKGSTRNGVTSNAYSSWLGSMTFDRTGAPGQIDWTTSAQPLPVDFQTPLVLRCPPQGSLTGRIWGTDTYHQDSAICIAAVHAGVITVANGGDVTLTPRAGTMTFTAAARNGVSSVAYRGAGGSFQVAAAQAMIGPSGAMRTAVAQTPTAQPPTAQPPAAQSGAFIGPGPVMRTATVAPPPATSTAANNESNAACGVAFANPCLAALNPASVKLNWAARTGANKYEIFREDRLVATVYAPAGEFVDDGLSPGQSAAYVVKAFRVTGTYNLNGQLSQVRRASDVEAPVASTTTDAANVDRPSLLETSNSRSVTTPTLATPTDVTAQSVGGPKGRVRVAWAPVAGANGYLVYRNGNALPVDSGAAASNASYDTGVPLGRHRYQVEALFTTANTRRTVNGEASTEVFAEVAFPQPTVRYLSLPGGPNDPQELEPHYRTRCGIAVWLSINECAKLDSILAAETAVGKWWSMPNSTFRDSQVLGLKRHVNCWRRRDQNDDRRRYDESSPVVCWANSHGPIQIPQASTTQAGQVSVRNSTSVILAYPDGRSFFGIWEEPTTSNPDLEYESQQRDLADRATALFNPEFDTQGKKPSPHVCLSCHGGRFDPASNMVVGASLLPLVPAYLSDINRSEYTEETIRAVNELVLVSKPAPAIVAQINALYNGTPQKYGTGANDAAVPDGWRFEPNIYRQVIGPYCASCHFAQRGSLSFATASDVRSLKDAVQKSVCETYTMPHAEIQFRRFWTEGGLMSLPGLLSTWLGFNTCGP